jgi:hypothetical protein
LHRCVGLTILATALGKVRIVTAMSISASTPRPIPRDAPDFLATLNMELAEPSGDRGA